MFLGWPVSAVGVWLSLLSFLCLHSWLLQGGLGSCAQLSERHSRHWGVSWCIGLSEIQGRVTSVWPSWDYSAEQNLVSSALSHHGNHSDFWKGPAKIQSYLGRWVTWLAGAGDSRMVIQSPALWMMPKTPGTACPTAVAPYPPVPSEVWHHSVKLILTSPLGILQGPVKSCILQLLITCSQLLPCVSLGCWCRLTPALWKSWFHKQLFGLHGNPKIWQLSSLLHTCSLQTLKHSRVPHS